MKKKHVVRVEIHFTPIAGFFIALMLFQLAFPRLFVSRVCAANLYVNTANDELDGMDGNGYCSLREAIMNANNDDQGQGDCIEGDGADVIFLLSETYTLTKAGSNEDANATGDLDIYGPLTINGTDWLPGGYPDYTDFKAFVEAAHLSLVTPRTLNSIFSTNFRKEEARVSSSTPSTQSECQTGMFAGSTITTE